MRKKQVETSTTKVRRGRPALTPEARENQLVSLAVDLAERQLIEGTASSQVITHYLKLASSRERLELEKEKLEQENQLLRARTEAIQSSKNSEEIYTKAINAMRKYSGIGSIGDETEDEEIF